MKLHALALIVIALVLVGTGPALANHFSSLEGVADCDGFLVNGIIYFAPGPYSIDVNYEVILTQGGTTIETITGTTVVPNAGIGAFSTSGAWATELCGDYTATGTFSLTTPQGSDSKTFTSTFTCACEEGGCHFTPGYWKNHAEAWPVTTLTLGRIPYNQAQLLAILNLPVVKDPTIILAHHLIAAMLNVANGADDSINGAIDHANALLVTYPLYSAPRGDAKTMVINAKNALAAYNETIMPGCEGYIAPCLDRALNTASDPGEKSSWGTIKSIYK
jgi:hypothetical protein